MAEVSGTAPTHITPMQAPKRRAVVELRREDQESGDQQCAGAVDQHEKIALAVFVSPAVRREAN